MIEVLDEIGRDTCANCGGEIVLLRGGVRAEWTHEARANGRYLRECPGSLYATPAASPVTAETNNTEETK